MQSVILQDSKKEMKCWIYLLHDYKPHMLELPYHISYSSKGDHGKGYVARGDRAEPGASYWTDVKFCDGEK